MIGAGDRQEVAAPGTRAIGHTIADDVLGQGSWPGGTGAPIVAPSNRRAYAARQVVEHLDGPALALEAAGLEAAARMLASGARVSQAAAACGFSSSSYFARAFKRRFRTAPMLWRPNTRRSQRDPPS
jgi:hypothetical protein